LSIGDRGTEKQLESRHGQPRDYGALTKTMAGQDVQASEQAGRAAGLDVSRMVSYDPRLRQAQIQKLGRGK